MKATSPDPFQAGGEMGKIIRSQNWSPTPLGAVEQWSVQLKTILNLVLNTCHPQFILWGNEQILLYNDAYYSIWGKIQPLSTLGQPLNSCWSEMSQEIASDLQEILETRQAILRENKQFNSQLFSSKKQRYFNISYSPILGQTGEVAGVLGTLIETTSQTLSQPQFNQSYKILERITDAFVALDRNWRYTYINQEAARLLGYTREELLGKELWKDVFSEEAEHPATQQLRLAMREQIPLQLETFSSVLNRYLEINACPSEEGISVYFRDISKRKQIESQLRSSEEFNRRIIESSMDCIKVLDLEGRLLLINSGGQYLLEINNIQPYLHQPWVEFWQDGDREKAEIALTQARIGKTSRFQGYCPSQTGKPKWWDVLLTPIFGSQGKVEQILALSREITNLKQAEDLLRTSESLYRTLSDAVPDFIWSCDSKGQTDFVNSRWIEYTGLTLEELNKKGLQQINHPDDYPYLQEAWDQAKQQGTAFEAEFRYRRHDGVYRWFMGRAVPLKDESGNIIKWIGITTDIHERKQAEAEREQLLQQLETERSRMRAILQQMPAGVLIADAETEELVLANQQVEEILGYSYALEWQLEAYDQDVTFEGFHPNGQPYRPDEYPLMRSLRTGEVVLGEEIEIHRADGQRIIIDVNSSPIRDQQGEILAAVVVFRDITYQRQAELALRRGEERFRALIEQAPDAVLIADLQGTYIDVNNNACNLLGYSREELIGKQILEIIPPKDQPRLEAVKQSLLLGNTHVEEWTLIRKDGTIVPVEISTKILPDGRWQAFVRDISERQQTQEALQTSEERFRQMAENVEDVFWIAQMQDYKVLYVSPAYETLWGYSCESLYANPYKWMEMIHPEDRSKAEVAFTEQVKTGRCAVEFRVIRPDGSIRWIRDRGFPIPEEDGQIRRVAGIAEDITERKQAEAALKQREEELRLITDAVPALIAYVDRDQRYRFVNRAYSDWFGHLPENIIGQHLAEFLGETAYQFMRPDVESALAGEPVTAELLMPFKYGGPRYVRRQYIPNIASDATVTGFYALITDITTLKQTEEALRQSEQRYRSLVSILSSIVWIADPEGQFIQPQPAWETYTGQSWSEHQNWGWLQAIHSDDQERVKSLWIQARDSKTLYQSEGRIWNTATQKYRYFEAKGIPLFNSDGSLREWVGTITDVDHRKRSEVALRQSEERFRQLAENIEDVFWIMDMQEIKILYVSPAYERIWGNSLQSLCNNPYDWLETIHPEDQERVRRAFFEQAVEGQFSQEYRIVRSDGSVRWIRDRSFPIYNEQGVIRRVARIAEDITPAKQVEAALRRSEQQFRVAQELSLYAFTILKSIRDKTGEIIDFEWIYVNPKAAEALKRPAEDLLGQRLLEVLPGNQFHFNLFKRYVEVVETGEPDDIELFYDADGIRGWFHNMAVKLEDGVAVSFSNISDRKQAEVALRLSEANARARAEELEALMEAVPAAIWIAHDRHCHQMSANLTAYELMRMFPGSVPTATPADGKNPLPFKQQINGKNIPPQELPMQKAGRTGEEVEGELEFIFDSGEVRYIYGKAVPLRDDNGQVRGVIGAFLDMTERKRAEEALQASEERFRLATRAVTGIVYDWDLQTNHVYRSEGLRQLIGLGPEEVPQDRDWWSERMHPEDRLVIQPQMLSNIDNGFDRYSFEYRVRHEDGHWVDVWDRGYILRDRKGELVRVVGSTADISDRKRAEAERDQLLARERAAREEAEAANRIKDEFLAVLSHELRSPLNPILGWANLLQRQKVDDKILHQALTTIERNVKLQVQLIDDLLDVSRILRGKLNLNRSSVDLRIVIISAVETVRLAAEAKSIEIKTHLYPQVGQVLGDAGRLQQIVWNLLSNSVKFSSIGAKVDIWLEQVGTEAQIRVKDAGKGISPEFLPHVFEYFRQEDGTTTRKFGGLGLGLAIVRYITEMHGGTVQADSPGEGQGATFIVKFPLIPQNGESAKNDQTLDAESFNPKCLQGIRILIAEDEADTRDFLTLMLKQAGATVIAVDSAIEALKAFMRSTPDILVSDIGMPAMDGYQLMKQVRSLYKNRSDQQMPAIALTAYAGESDFHKAIAAGFNQHICKPVEPDRLITAILDLVNR
ncbi:PAS domain S-box protein [Limnoraphis robusta]|uniref:PAS domain S-box protein n=1 Tax=Limnoraphis robusta TaxID=1118279 RepID=UPI002B21A000|nr:PAS domain S-box protein [Limnoraphis robusta]MEA5501075.1 PAS domain S-box protein [Limnoraphis robusta BA-68 BA1]